MTAPSEMKACIACAEDIKAQAALCKHCNTRQDDASFIRPKKSKSKQATNKTICLKCQRPLKVGEQSVCMSCQFSLHKQDLELIKTGVDIELCRVCNSRYYSPEISTECISCDRGGASSSKLFVSWWAQLILSTIAILLSGGAIFASIGILFAGLGGQLIGGNGLLSVILGLVYIAQGENHPKAHKTKNWLKSTLLFFGLGWALLLLGLFLSSI